MLYRPRLLFALLPLLTLLIGTAAARAEEPPPPLRMLVVAGTTMPLADLERDTLRSGLLKDLGERIAREVRLPLSFVVVPRKRIAESLQEQRGDMYCDTLPEWLPGAPALHWSAPVIWNYQYLVSAAPHPAPDGWDKLRGKTIVTLRGYLYPKPEELARGFESGAWTRSDAPNQETLLRRLQLGRGDFGIIGSLPLNWFRKNEPDAHFNMGLPVVSLPTRCALTRRAGFPAERVLQAIQRLSDNGELQRLTRAYSPGQ